MKAHDNQLERNQPVQVVNTGSPHDDPRALVARTVIQATETVVNNRQRLELPVKIIGVAPSGGQLNLGAVVEVAGGGLR